MEETTNYIQLCDLTKPELSMNQCTIINREIFTTLLALNFARVGKKKNSHGKKFLDFREKRWEILIPQVLSLIFNTKFL